MKWWSRFVQTLRNICVNCTQPDEMKELLESLGYAVSIVPSDNVSNGWYLVTMLVWDKFGRETNAA